MTEFNCGICRDSKRVRLPIHTPMEMQPTKQSVPTTIPCKDFDCPQCVPTVPYRRVRAMKVVTDYPAEQYGRFQVPIERSLAARFGEYLLREGLIRFSTKGSKDLGAMADKITVIAHLGVVSAEDTQKAGAAPEIATTARPPLPEKVTRRVPNKLRSNAVKWEPPPAPWASSDKITDEFDDAPDALGARFSGLEL